MAKVYLAPCPDYTPAGIDRALTQAFSALGITKAQFEHTKRLLIKPNLLMKRTPERATTTHPAVVEQVLALFESWSVHTVIADGPGGAQSEKSLAAIYRECGMAQAGQKYGVNCDTRVDYPLVSCRHSKRLRTFHAIPAFCECDGLINVCKLKTHCFTKQSGAVKNLFGLIGGMEKTECHMRFAKIDAFADMLVDLLLVSKARLHIMDAVIGMQGKGPSAGEPVAVGCLIISEDAFAVDIAAARLMGYRPHELPIIRAGIRRGLCDPAQVEYLGAPLESLKPPRFDHPPVTFQPNIYGVLPDPLVRLIDRAVKPYPQVQPEKCRGCGVCVRSCPQKTIQITAGKAKIHRRHCIYCYCCHELCDDFAITLHDPGLLSLFIR